MNDNQQAELEQELLELRGRIVELEDEVSLHSKVVAKLLTRMLGGDDT